MTLHIVLSLLAFLHQDVINDSAGRFICHASTRNHNSETLQQNKNYSQISYYSSPT